MKLIKIKEDHYVVVDDSEIKEGDWYISPSGGIISDHNGTEVLPDGWNKITHSTQPLGIGWQQEVIELSLKEVKKLIGEMDAEKKAEEYADFSNDYVPLAFGEKFNTTTKRDYLAGYNQALEDNKDRKYTRNEVHDLMCKAFMQGFKKADVVDAGLEGLETDVECAWILMRYDTTPLKTQWIVDFVDGKLKLKQ